MQLQLTGHNVEITDAMRNATQEKIKKHLTAFENLITRMHVTYTVDKSVHKIEGTAHVPHQTFHAAAEASEMYTALDELVDKMVRQLKKYKEKMKEHR